MQKYIDVYSYAYGNAAHNTGCADGASVLKKALQASHPHFHWHPPLRTSNQTQQRDALPDVAKLCETLSHDIKKSILNNRFFITVGGDHSCAIGSWSGALNTVKGDLGLIWFDAHMDSHTFATTLSNNIHGMPLAVLLGQGDPTLTALSSKKLNPENVVLIGIRSYENGEQQLLEKLGVTIFYMDDIKKLGMRTVINSAIERVTKNTTHFGISIDLDGFDPLDAPGVGTREKNGVSAKDFLAQFEKIVENPKLIGMDIAEFNPSLDKNHQTEKLAVLLCEQAGNVCELTPASDATD
ncbi:MAG: arginase [Coxiellaceae bacterium]|nr:arginase [Coxiellaceae bacterium]